MKIRKILKTCQMRLFDDYIDNIIEELKYLKQEYKDYELSFDLKYCEDYQEFDLIGVREETEDEKNARLYKEKLQEENQRLKELEEFERLKKKLGK